ncbi:MAG: ATP-dependent RecD-like DNA helicase [Syntrophus sp. SKADARSKE-3]|nr:ATP-dependent RecD-like DNA helicase [Syntrophus sp. SKADARSKE-3]
MTIHRMLKWEPTEKKFIYDTSNPLKCDMMIVDETSMLDITLAVNLFRAVKPGTTVIMVGDADQLPSVGPGQVLNDFIGSGIFTYTHLKKIFRQGEGSRIVSNAHTVNEGFMPEIHKMPKDELSDFYWVELDEPEKVTEMIVKLVKERIPARFGFDFMKDIQVLTPMNRGQCGTVTLNELLQNELNSGGKAQFKHGERTFKIGDRVMQTSNNYDKKVFNGDMGRISHIDMHESIFSVLYDEMTINYEFAEADQITLAYAVTVHKAQGCEFPAVVMPLLTQHYMMLQRKLLYTAMTRAKRLLVLIGSKKAVSMAVRNVSSEPRYSMLLTRLKN